MTRYALSLMLTLVSIASFAVSQTTTTYTLAAPNSGAWGGFRAFGIRTVDSSNNPGVLLNWIQSSGACNGQQAPFLGFVYLTLPGQAESPCAPLTSTTQARNGTAYTESGTFAGTDANNLPFSGIYSFDLTVVMKCSGGRGGCHDVFTINDGVVTITQ